MTLSSVFADLGGRDDGEPDSSPTAAIEVAGLVRRWLEEGPTVFEAGSADCSALDALCRQIDVRGRVSAAYGDGWTRLGDEEPAAPTVAAGVVAVLLANAARVGVNGNDGWGLKCCNSAFKALDLWPELPERSRLLAAALEVLDRVVDGTGLR